MGEAFFYHLTEDNLETTLPILVGKAVEAGWAVEVRTPNAEMAKHLDLALWQGGKTSFLPHGVAGGDHDALQPVLLTVPDQAADNGATCLVSVGGSEVSAQETQQSQRVMVIFDGMDPDAVARARVQWKSLTGGGCSAKYWAQDMGRWIKKAES